MLVFQTAKPATALHGEPASEIVGFGWRNDLLNTETPTALQVRRLVRRFGLPAARAELVAPLCYGEART